MGHPRELCIQAPILAVKIFKAGPDLSVQHPGSLNCSAEFIGLTIPDKCTALTPKDAGSVPLHPNQLSPVSPVPYVA